MRAVIWLTHQRYKEHSVFPSSRCSSTRTHPCVFKVPPLMHLWLPITPFCFWLSQRRTVLLTSLNLWEQFCAAIRKEKSASPLLTVCVLVPEISVLSDCNLCVSRTVHLIGSVESGVSWTCDTFVIDQHWMNRRPVLCSSRGGDSLT